MTVVCNVTGYPPPVLAVFTDEELEQPAGDDRVEVVGRGEVGAYDRFRLSITITNISTSDIGQYYCHASNTMGENTSRTVINITEYSDNIITEYSDNNTTEYTENKLGLSCAKLSAA